MDQPLTHENMSTAAARRDSNVSMDIAGETAVDRLLKHFETSLSGLDTEEAKRRLRHYGPNQPVVSRQPTLVAQVLNRIANPLVIVLLIASALSALAGDAASFIIVAIIVTISVSMDYLQERRAQNTIEALRETVALRARTIRDGKETLISTPELVPGDIINLAAGDLVPADGRIIRARDCFVSEALLTGEPYPVEKVDFASKQRRVDLPSSADAVLAGTSIMSGMASILVCVTGPQTQLGQLAYALVSKPPPTAFEVGLQRFSALILRITGLLVIFVLAESMAFQRPWLESLMFALALAVGLTPELLPMIVTVTLARGALRLAHDRVVVKRLAAIHNLGAMDVLCTDKTGTLIESKIALINHVDASGKDSQRVFELAYLNSFFETGLKNPLDEAILAHDDGDVAGWRKLDEAPFDFQRRRSSVLLEQDHSRLLIVKGAPEAVLCLCASFEKPNGTAEPLTDAARQSLASRFEHYGNLGLRVLAVAIREMPADKDQILEDDESGLAFSGFTIFLDPPKASARQAVEKLSTCGVEIKVLTGDNERVASHLLASLELPHRNVITGEQLSAMSEDALVRRLPEVNLFSRITPEQKLRVILALKRTGKTVGYLGDGINDAPALHSADVSISVDSATDVAKAAADIILLDKDLSVLYDGVIEGRRTVINVDKYIRMAISANFGNILSMAIAGLLLPFLPLLPVQVLLTNLLYDFAQLGLPFDNVDPESTLKPIRWNLHVIQRFMLIQHSL